MVVRSIGNALASFTSGYKLKLFVGGVFSFLNYCISGDIEVVKVIAILVAIDFVTGIMKAVKEKNFTSMNMMQTGGKVLLYFLLLVMGHQAELLFLFPSWTDEVVEGYIGFTEVFSIMENAAELGFEPAKRIVKIFNRYLLSEENRLTRDSTKEERVTENINLRDENTDLSEKNVVLKQENKDLKNKKK